MNPLQILSETRSDLVKCCLEQSDPGELILATEHRLQRGGLSDQQAHLWSAPIVWALCASVQSAKLPPGKRADIVQELAHESVGTAALSVAAIIALATGSLTTGWLGAVVGVACGVAAAFAFFKHNRERIDALDDAALAERHRQSQEQAKDARWNSRLIGASLLSGAMGLAVLGLLLYATNPDTTSFMAWRAKELKASSVLDALTPPDSRDLSVCSFYVVGGNTSEEKVYAGVLNHFFELQTKRPPAR